MKNKDNKCESCGAIEADEVELFPCVTDTIFYMCKDCLDDRQAYKDIMAD